MYSFFLVIRKFVNRMNDLDEQDIIDANSNIQQNPGW